MTALMDKLTLREPEPGKTVPLTVEPARPGAGLAECRDAIEAVVDERLLQVGALLFRGFAVDSLDDFVQFTRWFSNTSLDYEYGSTPRTQVKGGVYTSTEYPASQTIPLHNEMAYTTQWPMKLWFYSVTVAAEGGCTPICDSRKVYQHIPQAIREQFATKRLCYVRNYRVGMDVPWQKTFNTDDRDRVAELCDEAGIEYEWRGADELRTRQWCQAVAEHPVTGETVWFNQAHLFHISNLDARFRNALLELYGPEGVPRNVLYGDGTSIDTDDLDQIRQVLDEQAVVFPWRQGDIMMLDNMLAAHGRTPYKGERKVLVTMAEAHRAP